MIKPRLWPQIEFFSGGQESQCLFVVQQQYFTDYYAYIISVMSPHLVVQTAIIIQNNFSQFNPSLYPLPTSSSSENAESILPPPPSFPQFLHSNGAQVPGPSMILPLKYPIPVPPLFLLTELRPMAAALPGLVTLLPLFSPSLVCPSCSLNS